MIRVADYVIQFLEDYGVEDIFAVSGGGSIFLCDAVAGAKKLKYYCCHHEQAVAYAAEGYARKEEMCLTPAGNFSELFKKFRVIF